MPTPWKKRPRYGSLIVCRCSDGCRDWETLAEALECDDPALRDYYCYVLIDFIAVDRDLTDDALVRGLAMFGPLGWDDRLAELTRKELGLSKRGLKKLRHKAATTEATESAAATEATEKAQNTEATEDAEDTVGAGPSEGGGTQA